MKSLRFSIGILSWRGYDSLINSLISYEKNGLSYLTNDKFICLPEYTKEGIQIAKKFNYEPILIKKNKGILEGFKTLAEQMPDGPLLLLENDLPLIEDQKTTYDQLDRSLSLLSLPNVIQVRLRNRNNLTQFQCRTEKFRKSFFPDGIRLWNNLDERLRSSNDISEFKSNLPDVNTKSPELFNYGERRLNIIHTQLRLQCSNLKAHLFSLHVVDDPQCNCNIGNEDCFHFFFECPLYNLQRQDLAAKVQQLSTFNTKVLLHGDASLDLEINQQIFAAVHKYIQDSGRYR